MKKTFIVTVETADDLPRQYPNYRWNYGTPDEFIRARMEEFVHDGFGYTITYKPLQRKHLAVLDKVVKNH